jgi:hypothetical protein
MSAPIARISSAMQMLLPQKTIVAQGGNALQYFANQLLPTPWSYLMLLAILSSTGVSPCSACCSPRPRRA